MPWLYPPCTPGGLFLVHTRPAGTSRGPPVASRGEKEEEEEAEEEEEKKEKEEGERAMLVSIRQLWQQVEALE